MNQDLESSDKTEENFENISLRQTLNFPEVKFYLPTLRQGYTRFIPVWWNNETWAKNMNMFQFEEEILLVDCGIQFAEPDMLWANCSIPDITYMTPYKKNIKELIIIFLISISIIPVDFIRKCIIKKLRGNIGI